MDVMAIVMGVTLLWRQDVSGSGPILLHGGEAWEAPFRAAIEQELALGARAAAVRLGAVLPETPLAATAYSTHEEMGRALGFAGGPWFDTRDSRPGGVVFLADPIAPDEAARRARAAGALVVFAAIEPAVAATPLATAFCATERLEAKRTARDLASVGLLPPLAELAVPPRPLSPEVMHAALVALIDSIPAATFRADFERLAAVLAHPDAAPLAAIGNEFEPRWRAALADPTLGTTAPIDAPTSIRERKLAEPLHGFCFAHEGYRWFDGYGSRAAKSSLERLKEIGTEAISLTPFSFQRDAAAPTINAIFDRGGGFGSPGGETDMALEISDRDARSLGIGRVMKPHLWCGGGQHGQHAWCGEIAMTTDADWTAWFAEYTRVAVHYALLARRFRCEAYAIGTELKGTTHHEEEWRVLITRLRAIYPGKLTYCANWGDEATKLPFWDALDAVGVSDYWPLAEKPGAAETALRTKARTVIETMRAVGMRTGKPVWFLEIGFPDVKEPWITPHLNDGASDGGVDQARAYRIVLEESRAARFPDALFFWKWPSDLQDGTASRHDFWPCGRPAEQVLRELWTRRP